MDLTKRNKKRIVCFGDSNTWGYNGENGRRFSENIRWTGILGELLGEDYTIIEEGQNGRTFMNEDPWEGCKKGMDYLIPCIESQRPFDLFILMLGTNDLKCKFSLTAYDIATGLESMIHRMKGYLNTVTDCEPKILIMAPAPLSEAIKNAQFGETFMSSPAVIEKSKQLAIQYEKIAKQQGCYFLDVGKFGEVGDFDGVHLTPESHRKLAEKLAVLVQEMSFDECN